MWWLVATPLILKGFLMTSEKLVVLHIITGLNDGGAEAVMYNLIRTANDFEHKVISLMGPGKYGPKLEAEGFDVSYLELYPSLPSLLKLIKLIGMVRRATPDVVQCWMYHADLLGGYAAWRAGVRAIVWGLHHTTLDAQGTKWSTRQLVKLNTLVSPWLPRRIISCSNKGDVVHREIGYPAHKMVVVHNGYNTNAFTPDAQSRAAIRERIGIADDQLLLGCVARYNPQKDHRNLLLGFAEVVQARPDAHLLLIGPGLTENNTEVSILIADKGLTDQITMLGPQSDIPALMNGIDIHVLGSAFGEAFPNVLSEAMSCSTPCVATDVGDSATIVGETGRIVPRRDPAALAKAIIDLASQLPDHKLATACRDRILGNFTLAHMVQGYSRVWRDSIAEAKAGVPR
jgi:glycosyltransferase involved in cell wall biosynthesis